MSTYPNTMNQGDRQHGRKPGSGWGEGCPVFDRLWGRSDGASLDSGEDQVGGLGDERAVESRSARSLIVRFRDQGLDSFALTPLDFTTNFETELEELGNLACSNQLSLSYFQLPDQNDLALSSSQPLDDSADQTSSASWASADCRTTPCYMACTTMGPGEVFESPALIPHINTDETLNVNSQMIQEFDGRELAVLHDENPDSAEPAESLEGDTIAKPSPPKTRLSCQHPGCKKTFPRKWELQRHTKLKHEKSEDYHCYVYGCNRTSKPIGRSDKFREHWRTHHKRVEKLICIFDDCRRGPFMLHEFKEHIQAQHAARTTHEDHLNVILKLLDLWRLPSTPASMWLGSLLGCPLTFLGCDFSVGNDHSYSSMSEHLETHDIVERSLGHEAIQSSLRFDLNWDYPNWNYGIAHCPLCEEKWGAKPTHNVDVLSHVAAHTRESRSPHLKELYNMFQPYLLKKASFYGSEYRGKLANLQVEIEGAGLMPASTTPTND